MSPDRATPILSVRNLVKRFGLLAALDGITFDLHPGEVLGLVGPNGSGKTTCINVVAGLYPADSGTVTFDGAPLAGPAHRRAQAGINRTFQSPHPFASLSVRENVAVAAGYGGADRAVDTEALLASLALDGLADRPAHELNSAQQKTLDLARALATAPRLLLVVEHLMGFIDRVTDRVVVMNAGREIFGGRMADATRDPEVVRVYLGGTGG